VLKGKFPSLNAAAAAAARQWKYKPYVIDGRPTPVVFTVNVRFKLKESYGDSLEVGGDIPQPEVLKRVEPIYPEDARKSGIEGTVILYVTTDTEGRVAQVKVLKSIPALDRAAMDAVSQWVWEPYIHEGKPTPVSFSLTVSFKLK
jgi:TonB family protein